MSVTSRKKGKRLFWFVNLTKPQFMNICARNLFTYKFFFLNSTHVLTKIYLRSSACRSLKYEKVLIRIAVICASVQVMRTL